MRTGAQEAALAPLAGVIASLARGQVTTAAEAPHRHRSVYGRAVADAARPRVLMRSSA